MPFTSYAWNATWWKHFARASRAIADELAVRAVRNSDGLLVAVAPLMSTAVPARGPVRFRGLQFFGADPNITEVRGPLVDPEYAGQAYRTLFGHFESRPDDWDWIRWSGVPEDEADAVVRVIPRATMGRHLSECIVELDDTWASFKSSRPRNVKESLRRCRNSLQREGLTPSFEVAATSAELVPALSEFLRLHRARSERTDTVRHADFFSDENAQAFLSELCTTRSGIRIFTMTLESRVVAARIGFVVRDSLYMYYSGYDPRYARFGVMTSLVAEAMKYAIAHRLRTVNLSPGIDVSKTRWAPVVARTNAFTVSSRRPLGALSMQTYDRLRSALGTARRIAACLTNR